MKVKKFLLPLTIYISVALIGIWITFHPTITSGFSRMQADPGDTRLNHYFLEHSFQVMFNQKYGGTFWSPQFFYPFKNALALSDNLLGNAPLYWIFRSFLSPDISFQLWVIGTLLLCFASFSLLLRYFNVSHILSSLGGFIFAFGMPRVSEIARSQLLPQFYTSTAFLFLWNFIHKPSNVKLILVLLSIYLQLLAGIYLGWFLIMSLPFFLLIYLVRKPNLVTELNTYFLKNRISVAVIFLVWVSLMGSLLYPYVQMSHLLYGRYSFEYVSTMTPRLSSWLLPPPNSKWSILWEVLSPTMPKNQAHEHMLFIGFSVIFLTGLSMYVWFKKREFLSRERAEVIGSCLLVSMVLFVISLNELGIWKLVYWFVPGATAIRVVTRISFIIYFYLFISILLSLDSFLKVIVSDLKWRSILSALILLITISEQVLVDPTSFDKGPYLKVEAELQEVIGKGCDLAYVTPVANELWIFGQLSVMWAALQSNVPVINGYSSGPPPDYISSDSPVGIHELRQWVKTDSLHGILCIVDKISPTLSGESVHYKKSSTHQLPLR